MAFSEPALREQLRKVRAGLGARGWAGRGRAAGGEGLRERLPWQGWREGWVRGAALRQLCPPENPTRVRERGVGRGGQR